MPVYGSPVGGVVVSAAGELWSERVSVAHAVDRDHVVSACLVSHGSGLVDAAARLGVRGPVWAAMCDFGPSLRQVLAWSPAEVRAWATAAVLAASVVDVERTRVRYATLAATEFADSPEDGLYFQLVCDRVDEAFGFTTPDMRGLAAVPKTAGTAIRLWGACRACHGRRNEPGTDALCPPCGGRGSRPLAVRYLGGPWGGTLVDPAAEPAGSDRVRGPWLAQSLAHRPVGRTGCLDCGLVVCAAHTECTAALDQRVWVDCPACAGQSPETGWTRPCTECAGTGSQEIHTTDVAGFGPWTVLLVETAYGPDGAQLAGRPVAYGPGTPGPSTAPTTVAATGAATGSGARVAGDA